MNYRPGPHKSFQILKIKLASAPVLVLPKDGKNFMIYSDASNGGLGFVLMQKGQDYDLKINCHTGKAGKVTDALSRRDVGKVNLSALSAQPRLQETIKLKQNHDPSIAKIKEQLQEGKAQKFQNDEKGVLWIKGRLCVPDLDEIRREVISEAHKSKFSIHPGSTKMYRDLKQNYW
ncbi:uncharacterized protein [Primulina eburnea]|uniref:uncharacterized protein n=1 Tax=Primulina eburnea TaxID=1245227 RepID=UPI003C6BE9D9